MHSTNTYIYHLSHIQLHRGTFADILISCRRFVTADDYVLLRRSLIIMFFLQFSSFYVPSSFALMAATMSAVFFLLDLLVFFTEKTIDHLISALSDFASVDSSFISERFGVCFAILFLYLYIML